MKIYFRINGQPNGKLKLNKREIDLNRVKPKFLKKQEVLTQNKSVEKVGWFNSFLFFFLLLLI